MLKILGRLKAVTVKSKEVDDGDIMHTVDLRVEIIEGADRAQKVAELIKQIVSVDIVSKQPTLDEAPKG